MRLYAIQLPQDVSKDSEVFTRLARHVSPTVRERLDRIRLPEDALRSLVGRLAPTWYLYTSQSIPATTRPIYAASKTGKPYLESPPLETPFTFNLSHDGSYVLLGVSTSPGAQVGVDVMEYPTKPKDLQEGISFQLTREEKFFLAGVVGDDKKAEVLTSLWSMKEAYVKATGDGIRFGLERINVDLDVEGGVFAIHVDDKDVKLAEWDWANGTLSPDSQGSKQHRWAAYWTNDQWDGEIHHTSWTQFTTPFLDILP